MPWRTADDQPECPKLLPMTSELEADQQWWYNLSTGEVEQGMVSQSYDRVGPFATKVEAEHALEKLAANNAAWEDAESDI